MFISRALEIIQPRVRALPDRSVNRRGGVQVPSYNIGTINQSIPKVSRESITHGVRMPEDPTREFPPRDRDLSDGDDDDYDDSIISFNQRQDENINIPIAGYNTVGEENPLSQPMMPGQPPSMPFDAEQSKVQPQITRLSLSEFDQCVEDLKDYFKPAMEKSNSLDDFERERMQIDDENIQQHTRRLINRQNLFQEEGMIALILQAVDALSEFGNAAGQIGDYAISQMGAAAVALSDNWQGLLESLYNLLAAVLKGNRDNCSKFAQNLDWLILQLDTTKGASIGILEVLIALLEDSPDVLYKVKERHIKSIISLLEKHGRTPQVLDLLCSLCMCRGTAVRSNQNVICDNLLSGRDLLLQTRLCNQVVSVRPNVFVGFGDCCAQYRKWYYELVVEEVIPYLTPEATHLRIGWASTEGFGAYPGAGDGFGSNAVGDCLYSYGFDGMNLWTGGRCRPVGSYRPHIFQQKDVISCCLDLSAPSMSFRVNGQPVQGMFENFNLDSMFFPVVSLSAGVTVRFLVGGKNGEFKFMPPAGYAPAYEALLPEKELVIEPVRGNLGTDEGELAGPPPTLDQALFTPNPVDTSKIQLFDYLENIIEKISENIHELWSMTRIQGGWTFGLVRDDIRRQNPCLTNFDRLPEQYRSFNTILHTETIRTIISLGYHVGIADDDAEYKLRKLKLPRQYLMSNGYKPAPLDLTHVKLTEQLECLVEKLASNAHNVWAVDRIRQGWTYGYTLDVKNKRNPKLVPFMLLDEISKQSQRNNIRELVRTLLGYGFAIEPPDDRMQRQLAASGILGLEFQQTTDTERFRMFRVESTYAVTEGKWYFEYLCKTDGDMRVGWAYTDVEAGRPLGSDNKAYVFDGSKALKWHVSSEHYGRQWQEGEIVGCLLDFDEQTISFTLNGELLIDNLGMEAAFTFDSEEIDGEKGLVPCVAMYQGTQGSLNLGYDVDSFGFYTMYGMQEGYMPFCTRIKHKVPLWYTKSRPTFDRCKLNDVVDIKKSAGSATTPPCISVRYKSFGSMRNDPEMVYLRLNMPVHSAENYSKTNIINVFGDNPDEGVTDFDQDMDMLGYSKQEQIESQTDIFSGFMKTKPKKISDRLKKDIKADEPNILYKRDVHRLLTTTQYMFCLRVFPGQDISNIWVGWVTPGFHLYNAERFDQSMARSVTLTIGDAKGRITETIKRSDCFMLSGADIVKDQQAAAAESASRADTVSGESGTLITCIVNTATGLLQFKVNEKIMSLAYQVEPNTMLYPAAFFLPTTYSVMQFELGRTKHQMPISAGMFKSESQNVNPQLPPRLNCQILRKISWTRLPNKILQADISKPSPRTGWFVKVEKPVRFLAVHIPEEYRCLDILELIEHQYLLKFHTRTLRLYSNMCALGNYRVAHALCSYIDQQQFIYCINSQYLSGPLRVAYHDLLIDIFLAPHADARRKTQNEFILPLNEDLKKITLYDNPDSKDPGLPGVTTFVSLRSPFTRIFQKKITFYYSYPFR